jgi:hypothetical protein
MCNSVISDCSYNLGVVNKTNYQSEPRLQSAKHVTIRKAQNRSQWRVLVKRRVP